MKNPTKHRGTETRKALAYDLRRKRIELPPELLANEYSVYFQNVIPMPQVNQCIAPSFSSYFFNSDYLAFNNKWFKLGLNPNVYFESNAQASKYVGTTTCNTDPPNNIYNTWLIRRNLNFPIFLLLTPGQDSISGGDGTFFDAGPNQTVSPSSCVAKNNLTISPNANAFKWAGGGTVHVFRGPLSSKQVLDLLNSTLPT